MDRVRIMQVLAISIVGFNFIFTGANAQDIRCYECTSYMKQCEDSVDANNNMVFKTKCKSKCYARIGEDGAIYRGCFSYFEDATGLQYDYTGCHNQTWNNKNLMWCLCDTDLCNGQSIKRMSRSRYSEYSPKLNQVYDSDNYIEADYIHDNEKTKLMPNSASGMYGYAKEGPMDDTYQEPHMKLWESGYNDVYNIYNNNGHSNYRDESYSTQKNDERDYYDSSNYRMIQQYSRSDEEKDEYDRNDFYNYNDVHQARYDNQAGWMDYSYDRGDGHQVLKEGVEEEDDNYSSEVSPELASQIRCSKTGYYQNPHDCRQFIACLMDPHSNVPIMHLMRCPPGLVFDNRKKICLTHSATCNSGTDYYEYDSHSQPRDSTYNIRPSYDSEFPRNENKRLEDNYENMLYDSEKKIDTTGFVQGGTGPDNKHAYNVDDHYDAKYNENFIDDYDNIYNGNDYGSYDLKHIQNRG